MSADEHPRIAVSWERAEAAAAEAIEQIRRDGYEPEVLVELVRGGAFLAVMTGYALDVRTKIPVHVIHYDINGQLEGGPKIEDPLPDPAWISGKRVLVVDDTLDTGYTVRLVVQELQAMGALEVRVAVLFQKEQSIVDGEYVGERVGNDWLDFPFGDGWFKRREARLALKA